MPTAVQASPYFLLQEHWPLPVLLPHPSLAQQAACAAGFALAALASEAGAAQLAPFIMGHEPPESMAQVPPFIMGHVPLESMAQVPPFIMGHDVPMVAQTEPWQQGMPEADPCWQQAAFEVSVVLLSLALSAAMAMAVQNVNAARMARIRVFMVCDFSRLKKILAK